MRSGFHNHEWAAKFIANSLEFAAMARRIGEEALALDFEAQAQRARDHVEKFA